MVKWFGSKTNPLPAVGFVFEQGNAADRAVGERAGGNQIAVALVAPNVKGEQAGFVGFAQAILVADEITQNFHCVA